MVTSVLMAALAGGGQPNMIPVVIAYFASIGIWVYQIVLLVKTGQTLARKWLQESGSSESTVETFPSAATSCGAWCTVPVGG